MVPAIAHPIVFGGKQFPRVCAGRARVCLKLDFALIIATSRSSFLATKRRSDSSCKSCPMLRDAFVGEKDWCASEGVFAIISKIWKRSFFFLLFFPSFVKWKSVVVEKTGNENEKGERERERKRQREFFVLRPCIKTAEPQKYFPFIVIYYVKRYIIVIVRSSYTIHNYACIEKNQARKVSEGLEGRGECCMCLVFFFFFFLLFFFFFFLQGNDLSSFSTQAGYLSLVCDYVLAY